MTNPLTFLIGSIICIACACRHQNKVKVIPVSSHCDCDTTLAKSVVTSDAFNQIPQYDTSSFTVDDFYNLSDTANRELWYRDIENPDTTKFTKLWDAYAPFNYSASQRDFINYYRDNKRVELAFQFGPNRDLWAYHIFVIRKVGCCYLITRSYFRHARFTYKAWSIINEKVLDSLREIIRINEKIPVTEGEMNAYCGVFVDKRNNETFLIKLESPLIENTYVDIHGSVPAIKALYDFVDTGIRWKVSYRL